MAENMKRRRPHRGKNTAQFPPNGKNVSHFPPKLKILLVSGQAMQ